MHSYILRSTRYFVYTLGTTVVLRLEALMLLEFAVHRIPPISQAHILELALTRPP